ncbi:MAG: ATP-binding cassette domain-containing protein [Defluviitaleaceae bacterium]|nr:ATP-binding cassette domain-containing protein [Defluviitaleaceae bacterium]
MDYVKIRLENISLEISGKKILRNINLTLKENNVYVFIGKSGSGKTSLLNIMNFLYTPTSGNVYYENKIINFEDEEVISQLRNQEIAYFQQELTFIENMTIRENLNCFAKIKNVTLDLKLVDIYSKKLNIINLLDENISILSGGERQRASFLKLLVLPANVVLIDEPTNNLDKENIFSILEGIKVMKENGKTVIIVSHSDVILQVADSYFRMEDINES